MIDIEDKNYPPNIDEIFEFTDNQLLNELDSYLLSEYKALRKIEYSGDNVLLGWNVKFKKAGRTLCTLYPRQGYFHMLLIIGRREKEAVEALLPEFSEDFRNVYSSTKEGMGQRWLLFDFRKKTSLYDDVKKVIHIRRAG